MKRRSEDRRLRSEIAAATAESDKVRAVAMEMDRLRKLFPAEIGTTSFIEDLYSAAQLSKLTLHEASTETSTARPTARPGQQPDALSSTRLKIRIEGNYRSIAEYVRRVQNLERFKKITEMRFSPDKNGITGSLVMELYALKGNHAR
jgi:Tfp pilus assembly protein PilO